MATVTPRGWREPRDNAEKSKNAFRLFLFCKESHEEWEKPESLITHAAPICVSASIQSSCCRDPRLGLLHTLTSLFQVLVAACASCTPAAQTTGQVLCCGAPSSGAALWPGARSALCCIIKFSPEWELRNSPLKTWTLWVRGRGRRGQGSEVTSAPTAWR